MLGGWESKVLGHSVASRKADAAQDLRLEWWPETTESVGTHLALTTKGAGSNISRDVLGRKGATSHPTHWEMTS